MDGFENILMSIIDVIVGLFTEFGPLILIAAIVYAVIYLFYAKGFVGDILNIIVFIIKKGFIALIIGAILFGIINSISGGELAEFVKDIIYSIRRVI